MSEDQPPDDDRPATSDDDGEMTPSSSDGGQRLPSAESAQAPDTSDASGDAGLHKKMAGSASKLLVRQGVVQGVSALSTAVLARTLGVSGFGSYAAGLALFYVFSALCDFGFGSVLARELGAGRADDGTLVRSMLRVQVTWTTSVGLAGLVVCGIAGFHEIKIQVFAVLLPCIAFAWMSGVRQVFYANYRVGTLSIIDVVGNVLQAVAVIAVALAGAGPLLVGAVLSATTLAMSAVVLAFGLRHVDAGKASRGLRRRLFKHSWPLGLNSLLTSAYFTLDLSIVSFLVAAHEVAYYAGATKFLSILVMVPGIVVSAVLPGMSGRSTSVAALGTTVGKAWQWLAFIGLPLCLGLAFYAPLAVRIFFGPSYAPAVPLVRILAVAGVVTLVTNTLGTALIATRRSGWLIGEGIVALVVNVAGNLALVPRYGVVASAWLTVATELVVLVAMVIGLVRRLDFTPLVRASVAPVAATVATCGVWVATRGHLWLSVPLVIVSFVLVLAIFGGWPDEVPVAWPKRLVIPGLSFRPATDS